MLSIGFQSIIYLSCCLFITEAVGARTKLSIPVTNDVQLVSIPITVGHPGRVHRLAIGTGSSYTFCGAQTPYVPTPTTVDLHRPLAAYYMYGNATGRWVNDTVTFGSAGHQIELPNITIGNASSFIGFNNYDGMMGLSRVGESDAHKDIETLWTPASYMWHRHLLEQNIFSISLKPTRTFTPEENGMITFGGIERSLFTGEIYWYDCQSYTSWDWTTSVTYGGKLLHASPIMGNFDTAYTLGPALADDLFAEYLAAIPGAIWNNDDYWINNPGGYVNRHLLKIPKTSIGQMKDLCFTASDNRPWCLTPEAQLIPENVITDPTYRFSYVSPLGSTTEHGTTFVFGLKGLERFYSVFDMENYRIGLAETSWTKTKF